MEEMKRNFYNTEARGWPQKAAYLNSHCFETDAATEENYLILPEIFSKSHICREYREFGCIKRIGVLLFYCHP